MQLRTYQERVINCLYNWWCAHTGIDATPLLVMPTGSGKSHVIAELTRLLFDTWPESHPRTIVIVPSKELAEQNAAKLVEKLPSHISLGYYAASLGRKVPDADVIVATIGSIYKAAHLLGNIKCVIIDEAHLINPNGVEAGRYRQFLTSLAKLCQFRVVGLTATPFRGNGVWLTDGEAPIFTGVAATVTVKELLDAGYLAPLVRPTDLATRIDTAGIKTTSGDYNIAELSDRIEGYLPAAADDACTLAADRKKWIAFTATVLNARHLSELLNERGIITAVVTGDTPAADRARLIADFRAGRLRCLVTVLALATGFDVPDVDCILWLRPTISPVLYVQGSGRGLRIAPGKTDCLWLDFSDTTDRLGPVDSIKGRKKRGGKDDKEAPHAICDTCGEVVRPASLMFCPSCGAQMRDESAAQAVAVSNAPIMEHQAKPKIVEYPVSRVEYSIHQKEGKPDSLRVDYYAGLRRVGSEWVCFEHQGFARAKAEQWWDRRMAHYGQGGYAPRDVDEVMCHLTTKYDESGRRGPLAPAAITVNETGQFPEIIGYQWPQQEQAA